MSTSDTSAISAATRLNALAGRAPSPQLAGKEDFREPPQHDPRQGPVHGLPVLQLLFGIGIAGVDMTPARVEHVHVDVVGLSQSAGNITSPVATFGQASFARKIVDPRGRPSGKRSRGDTPHRFRPRAAGTSAKAWSRRLRWWRRQRRCITTSFALMFDTWATILAGTGRLSTAIRLCRSSSTCHICSPRRRGHYAILRRWVAERPGSRGRIRPRECSCGGCERRRASGWACARSSCRRQTAAPD